MKYIHLFVFSFITQNIFAQLYSVPNGGFEIWNVATSWHEPDGMNTGNTLCISIGNESHVNKTTQAHGGQFAAELTTQGDAFTGLFPGAIAIGSLGYEEEQPIAFSSKPDSIEFYAMHNIAAGDAASVLFEFYNAGSIVGSASLEIEGMTDSYVRYVMPVNYENELLPDHMAMIAVNTNWANPMLESTLLIDDFHFIYNEGSGDQMPNGGFELWTEHTISGPEGWPTSNSFTLPEASVSPDTDAFEGQYSCRIENIYSAFADASLSFIFLGDLFNDECSPLDAQYPDAATIPTAVNFHYKYECENPEDSASLYFYARRSDPKSGSCEEVLEDALYLPVTSEWTPASYQVPSNVIAAWLESYANGLDPLTNLTLAFIPGEVPSDNFGDLESTDGAVLWIDAVEIVNDLLISVIEQNNHHVEVYPNPANDMLNIRIPSGIGAAKAELHDITGKLLISANCTGSLTQIDATSLPQGVYLLNVSGENFHSQEKIVIAH